MQKLHSTVRRTKWRTRKKLGSGGYGTVRCLLPTVVTKKTEGWYAAWSGLLELQGLGASQCPIFLGHDRDEEQNHFIHLVRGVRLDHITVPLTQEKPGPELAKMRVTVMRWMGDVAEDLAYAHARGVVHGDIKRDNIIVYHPATLQKLDKNMRTRWVAPSITDNKVKRATLVDWGMCNGAPYSLDPKDTVMSSAFTTLVRAPELLLFRRYVRSHVTRTAPVPCGEEDHTMPALDMWSATKLCAGPMRPPLKDGGQYADRVHDTEAARMLVPTYGGATVVPPRLHDPMAQDVYAVGICLLRLFVPYQIFPLAGFRNENIMRTDLLTQRVVLFGPPPPHLGPAYKILHDTFHEVVPPGGAIAAAIQNPFTSLAKEEAQAMRTVLKVIAAACQWDPALRPTALQISQVLRSSPSPIRQPWRWDPAPLPCKLHWDPSAWISAWTVCLHLAHLTVRMPHAWEHPVGGIVRNIVKCTSATTVAVAWQTMLAWLHGGRELHEKVLAEEEGTVAESGREMSVKSEAKRRKLATPTGGGSHSSPASASASASSYSSSPYELVEHPHGLDQAVCAVYCAQLTLVDQCSLPVWPRNEQVLSIMTTFFRTPSIKGCAATLLQHFCSTIMYKRCARSQGAEACCCWDRREEVGEECIRTGKLYSAAHCALFLLAALVPDCVSAAPEACVAAAVRLVTHERRLLTAQIAKCLHTTAEEVHAVLQHAGAAATHCFTPAHRATICSELQHVFCSRRLSEVCESTRWPLYFLPLCDQCEPASLMGRVLEWHQ